MADEQDANAALYIDNTKPAIVQTGANDAAANWQGAFGVPFGGRTDGGDGLTMSERAVRAKSPELVPDPVVPASVAEPRIIAPTASQPLGLDFEVMFGLTADPPAHPESAPVNAEPSE